MYAKMVILCKGDYLPCTRLNWDVIKMLSKICTTPHVVNSEGCRGRKEAYISLKGLKKGLEVKVFVRYHQTYAPTCANHCGDLERFP